MDKKAKQNPLPVWARIALIAAGVILLAVLSVTLLGMRLLGRVSRPEPALAAVTLSPATPTPAPASGQSAQPSPTPAATPQPTPLPLSEVYPQTLLSDGHYAQMETDAANTEAFRNVLLIGVDRRSGSGTGSADTIMIATVDKQHGRLKLTSLLRDMLLPIPGYAGYDKLNSAATKGGVPLLMQTVNTNYRLDIRDYVLVDFNMFIQIVDAMGGVTVSMSAAEISAANDCIAGLNRQWGVDYLWDGFIFAEAGNVKCTGKQALGFARIRHLDSDFKRTGRQYEVMQAIYAKFRSLSPAKQYDILYELLPLVETNMTNQAILDAGLAALSMDTRGILQFQSPAADTYQSERYNGKSVLLTDITENARLVHQFIYENADEAKAAVVLAPGASLPPRTPRPIYGVPDINGNLIYYYEDGTLVPGQNLIIPEGMQIPGTVPAPVQTPWQSLG